MSLKWSSKYSGAVLHTTKVCWQWVLPPRRRAGNCESPTTKRAEAVRRYRQLMTNSRTQMLPGGNWRDRNTVRIGTAVTIILTNGDYAARSEVRIATNYLTDVFHSFYSPKISPPENCIKMGPQLWFISHKQASKQTNTATRRIISFSLWHKIFSESNYLSDCMRLQPECRVKIMHLPSYPFDDITAIWKVLGRDPALQLPAWSRELRRLPPPRRLCFHRRLLTFFICLLAWITRNLLNRLSQNLMKRWHMGHGRTR